MIRLEKLCFFGSLIISKKREGSTSAELLSQDVLFSRSCSIVTPLTCVAESKISLICGSFRFSTVFVKIKKLEKIFKIFRNLVN